MGSFPRRSGGPSPRGSRARTRLSGPGDSSRAAPIAVKGLSSARRPPLRSSVKPVVSPATMGHPFPGPKAPCGHGPVGHGPASGEQNGIGGAKRHRARVVTRARCGSDGSVAARPGGSGWAGPASTAVAALSEPARPWRTRRSRSQTPSPWRSRTARTDGHRSTVERGGGTSLSQPQGLSLLESGRSPTPRLLGGGEKTVCDREHKHKGRWSLHREDPWARVLPGQGRAGGTDGTVRPLGAGAAVRRPLPFAG